MGTLKSFLDDLNAPLSQQQARELFAGVVDGSYGEIEIASLVVGLKAVGESSAVLAGAVQALRTASVPFPLTAPLFADSCGTGGDGLQTVNISTAVAIVAAELGLPMVKHGNRSVSSLCGSADLLEQLGIPLDLSPKRAKQCLDEAGICFLFAPHYHPGLSRAMPVRRALKTRTIFNLLGPLLNPSAPPVQVVGVYDPRWCRPLAEALGAVGCRAALVVHGSGLDEIALHGPTEAVLWRDGEARELCISPAAAGLEGHPLSELEGGRPTENALWLQGLLEGRGSLAHRSAVALNAGALLWIAGLAGDLVEGTSMAMRILEGSRGWNRFQGWRTVATAL